MVLSRPILCLVLALFTAEPAIAQEIDPIGTLLDRLPTPTQTPQTPEAWRPAPVMSLPKPRAVTTGEPVKIEDIGKTPDAPLSANDLGYEARLRSAFQSAQGSQGPLEGRWIIRAGDVALYTLQLVDRGALEGAWRDPRRPAASGATGFIDIITRNGEQMSLSFIPTRGGAPVSLSLQLQPDGQISGEMVERGLRSAVTMVRQ